jgi:hypothetical protein
MIIYVDGNVYETKYFPFFRIRKSNHYDVYSLRYPSGFVEEVMIFDTVNYIIELKKYLEYLIREYMYEDDIMLTVFAKRLKKDVNDLFYETRRCNTQRND